jgi:hypothetical protein
MEPRQRTNNLLGGDRQACCETGDESQKRSKSDADHDEQCTAVDVVVEVSSVRREKVVELTRES